MWNRPRVQCFGREPCEGPCLISGLSRPAPRASLRGSGNLRNPENKWFDIGSLTVIVAGIIMVFTLYSFDNSSNAYISSMKNMELEAINTYKHLSAEINRKNESLTTGHPEMEKPVFATQAVTAYVASVFYQYRNSLLSSRYQNDFAEIEPHVPLAASL